MAKMIQFYIPEGFKPPVKWDVQTETWQGARVPCRGGEEVRVTLHMKYETQDRRQHPRTDDTLTKIEDLTYSALRKSAAEPGSVQHESARISGRMSYALFLLVPILAIPLIAILFSKAPCLSLKLLAHWR